MSGSWIHIAQAVRDTGVNPSLIKDRDETTQTSRVGSMKESNMHRRSDCCRVHNRCRGGIVTNSGRQQSRGRCRSITCISDRCARIGAVACRSAPSLSCPAWMPGSGARLPSRSCSWQTGAASARSLPTRWTSCGCWRVLACNDNRLCAEGQRAE